MLGDVTGQVRSSEQAMPPRSRYIFAKIPKKIGDKVLINTGDDGGIDTVEDSDSSATDGRPDDGKGKGKRKEEEVDEHEVSRPDPYSGWGLCFEESFRPHRLRVALFLLYCLMSLGIIIWYIVVFGFPKLQM